MLPPSAVDLVVGSCYVATMDPSPRPAGHIAGVLLPILEWKLVQRVLKMGGGYVLNFSDPSFADFFATYGVNIDDRSRFYEGGTSKANRLRTFLRSGEVPLVGRVLIGLLDYGIATNFESRGYGGYEPHPTDADIAAFRAIAGRFGGGAAADGSKMKRFRVALSFTGEKRQFVDQVARLLAGHFGDEKVLYDKFHEAEFARRDLGIYLPDLYNKESDLVVVVVCPDYERKPWTGLEWAAIHDLLRQRKDEEVMLCRFDYATVKGLYGTSGFVELDDRTPQQAVNLILHRLAINEGRPKDHYLRSDETRGKRLAREGLAEGETVTLHYESVARGVTVTRKVSPDANLGAVLEEILESLNMSKRFSDGTYAHVVASTKGGAALDTSRSMRENGIGEGEVAIWGYRVGSGH